MSSMIRGKHHIGHHRARLCPFVLLALGAAICPSLAASAQDGRGWDAAHAQLLGQPAASDSIAGAIATWKQLLRTPAHFDTIASFLMLWPDFPAHDHLQKMAEKSLIFDQVPADRLVAFFDRFAPLTNPARAHYALALAELGRRDASDVGLAAWRGGAMSDADEAAIRSRWSARFSQSDDDSRLDALLWAGATTEAWRALPYASPQAAVIGQARIALQNTHDISEASQSSDEERAMALATAAANPSIAVTIPPATSSSAMVDGNGAIVTAAVPTPAMLADPGYLVDRARALARQSRVGAAADMLAQHPALAHPALDQQRWITTLYKIARLADAQGDFLAVVGVADHAGEGFGALADISAQSLPVRDKATSLFWLGGTTALWRLGQMSRAAALFEDYASAARSPESRAKGYYWAGRAIEAMGAGRPEARMAFAYAARYPGQYYGLLALERLGKTIPPLGDTSYYTLSSRERAAFAAKPLTQAVRELARDGDWQTTVRFFRTISDQAHDRREEQLVADEARTLGRRDLGVILGQAAANRGELDFRLFSYPQVPVPLGVDWTWSHAISRQESEFSRDAMSSVGARGLMQLMPGTAADEARKLGLGFTPSELTEDPGFNMTLGNAYFHHLLEVFGGSYPLAVAAYNAGPGNVSRWLATNGDPRLGSNPGGIDWVTWIERIPFSETRNYVQHVIANAVVYEALYPQRAAYHGPNPLSYYLGKHPPG